MKKFCVILLLTFTLIVLGCTKSEPPPQIDKSKYQRVDDMGEFDSDFGGGIVYNNPDSYWVVEVRIEKGYQKKDKLERPIEGIYWYKGEKGSHYTAYFDYPSKYKIKPGIYDIYFHGRDGIYYQADLFEEKK